ncbi:MAG TPA: HD domain-containing protein [Blastocatellia bacterium]|nr:HD domain-containing protein [Blastocatellia bacterium]
MQTAFQAEQEGASDALIAAALLHDIGHLLHKPPEDIATGGVDGWHEQVGATWLSRYFPAAVTERIRLHVGAKRYLCVVDSEYQRELSIASIQSLALQGGPMNEGAARDFEAMPYVRESVRLRRWDDQAKVIGRKTPVLTQYQSLLEKLADEGRP